MAGKQNSAIIDNNLQAQYMIMQAYDDYLASRFLLNNNFGMQGSILASTSIEKYLKAILIVLKGEFAKVHLDNFIKLKSQFDDTEYGIIFDYIDRVFFDILGKAFTFRYYDNIIDPQTIGFFINQFLGELDFTVHLFENLFRCDIGGKEWKSPYKRAIDEKLKNLFDCNYILNKIDKKTFMTSESEVCVTYLNHINRSPFLLSLTQKHNPPYDGKIIYINVRED